MTRPGDHGREIQSSRECLVNTNRPLELNQWATKRGDESSTALYQAGTPYQNKVLIKKQVRISTVSLISCSQTRETLVYRCVWSRWGRSVRASVKCFFFFFSLFLGEFNIKGGTVIGYFDWNGRVDFTFPCLITEDVGSVTVTIVLLFPISCANRKENLNYSYDGGVFCLKRNSIH